jgi:hypothetical protein
MKASSWVQHCSNRVIEFGKHGHLQNAGYSYGWSHTSAARQQIGLSGMDYLTQRNALFVTRRMKIFIDHLLVSCVLARQFWYHLLRQVGLHLLAPQPTDYVFDDWWEVSLATSGLTRRGLNSLIILGALTIWNHRNKCVANVFLMVLILAWWKF